MDGYGKRVLVVDDDHHVRFLLVTLLDHAGYTVVPACDGLAALNELSKRHFDVVVTDYRMPVLNGIDLLKQIQVHYPRLPVIMVSATLPEEFSRLDYQPFACIRKPYNNMLVLKIVQSAAHGQITSWKNGIPEVALR
jgi:two-component system, response regulator, stage 0 sporulation protein F